MAIRFPKMHIAKSVSNRIMNIADEIDTNIAPMPSIESPSLPETDPKGASIDLANNTPIDEVSAPEGMGLQDTIGPESII